MSRKSRRRSPLAIMLVLGLLLGAASYFLGNSGKQSQAEAKPPPAKVKLAPTGLHYTDHPAIAKLATLLPTVRGKKGVAKGKTRITPRGITLHWWEFSSGGDINGLRTALRNNPSCDASAGCSVQFGVTQDGKIYQMMRYPNSFALQASGANETTIGIEIEGGPTDFAPPNKTGFNKAKFEAVVSLVLMLMKKYPTIEMDGTTKCWQVVGIHGHDEYNACRNPGAGTKLDPGPAYTKAVKDAVKNTQR